MEQAFFFPSAVFGSYLSMEGLPAGADQSARAKDPSLFPVGEGSNQQSLLLLPSVSISTPEAAAHSVWSKLPFAETVHPVYHQHQLGLSIECPRHS